MERSGYDGRSRAVVICCCGVALRIGLALSGLQPKLASAMELVVSSTSWELAQEGYFLGTLGLSHYAGGVFLGSPLMLAAVALCVSLPSAAQALAAAVLFAAADLASALLLRAICVRAVAVESGDWETQLEKWMDEDSTPPAAGSASPPNSFFGVPAATQRAAPVCSLAAAATKARSPVHNNDDSESPPPAAEQVKGVPWDLPDIVLAAYLLNPVIAGQCAALSGDVLGRVLPLAALAASGSRRPRATAAALAAAACLWRFYAVPLILPAALMLANNINNAPVSGGSGGGAVAKTDGVEDHNQDRGSTSGASSDPGGGAGMASKESRGVPGVRGQDIAGRDKRQQHTPENGGIAIAGEASTAGGGDDNVSAAAAVVAVEGEAFDPRYFDFDGKMLLRLSAWFVAWCAVILGACWAATSGSWAFLGAAARGQFLCENLTPNIGLYWYFFAEVFPRFRGYFRVLFLSHPYVYVLPATLRLGMFPEALASLLLAIFGLFQPYPTLADPMLAGCLFLCHPRTSARMRLVIPVGMAALLPSLLLPTMRHLWLRAGTGNANFYYFQTVALNVLLAVFVLQFAAALVKRRKALTEAFQKRRRAALGEAAAAGGEETVAGSGIEECCGVAKGGNMF